MDFITGLPRTPSGYDLIWVIVDRLTKSAHFLQMKKIDSMEKITQLYLKEIVLGMECLCQLYRIEIVVLHLDFGDHFKRPCASPWKGMIQFGKRGKLSLWYVGTFNIIDRIGLVAYKLELPDKLHGVHNTFHVSNLKKCLADENLIIPLEEIQLDDKLHSIEEPVEIMDREVKQLKQSRIPIVKVRWNSRRGLEFTWEREDFFKSKYPHIFSSKKKAIKKNRALGRRTLRGRRM
nr:putative reverse transcriptase domain-containing protein [Tanacetum cinerariifolium]